MNLSILLKEIYKNLPNDPDMSAITRKYLLNINEVFNFTVHQEVLEYTRNLERYRIKLEEYIRAVNDVEISNNEMKADIETLLRGKLPASISKRH